MKILRVLLTMETMQSPISPLLAIIATLGSLLLLLLLLLRAVRLVVLGERLCVHWPQPGLRLKAPKTEMILGRRKVLSAVIEGSLSEEAIRTVTQKVLCGEVTSACLMREPGLGVLGDEITAIATLISLSTIIHAKSALRSKILTTIGNMRALRLEILAEEILRHASESESVAHVLTQGLGHESLLGHGTAERGLSGGAVESTESERRSLWCGLVMG